MYLNLNHNNLLILFKYIHILNNVEKYNLRSHLLSYNIRSILIFYIYIYNSHIIKKKNYTKDLLENNILLMKYMKNYITTNKKYIKNITKNLFYFCY